LRPNICAGISQAIGISDSTSRVNAKILKKTERLEFVLNWGIVIRTVNSKENPAESIFSVCNTKSMQWVLGVLLKKTLIVTISLRPF
jgi:hypothetical protein